MDRLFRGFQLMMGPVPGSLYVGVLITATIFGIAAYNVWSETDGVFGARERGPIAMGATTLDLDPLVAVEPLGVLDAVLETHQELRDRRRWF